MNEKERMALHVLYKEKIKDICRQCVSYLSENISDDTTSEEIETLIDGWVETVCIPMPHKEWTT
jgi:hypothetical protein